MTKKKEHECPLAEVAHQIWKITELADTEQEALVMGRYLSSIVNDQSNHIGESIKNFFEELERPIYCPPKELEHAKKVMAESKHKRRIIVMDKE